MKIPFDIKYRPQIESGEYEVETRDGSPARVVCWDANNYTPIIFLVTEHDYLEDKDKEYTYSCNNFGRTSSIEFPRDLFIITPDPKLSEFEQELENFYNYYLAVCSNDNPNENLGTLEENLHYWADKLLTVAREELVRQGYTIEKKASDDAAENNAVENIEDKHKGKIIVEYSSHCKVENGVRRAVMNWDEFQKVAQKFIDTGKAEAVEELLEEKDDESPETMTLAYVHGLLRDEIKAHIFDRSEEPRAEAVVSIAKRMLRLAENEVRSEALKKYKQSWFNEGKIAGKFEGLTEDEKYQQGVHDGKEEALKDLPKWKKLGGGNNYSSETNFAINGRYLEMNDTLNDLYDMPLSELEKLPKDDRYE